MRLASTTCSALLIAAFCLTAASWGQDGDFVSLEVVNSTPGYPLTVITYNDDYDCYGQTFVSTLADSFTSRKISLPRRSYQTLTFQYFGGEAETSALPGGGISSTTCTGVYSFPTGEASEFRVTLARAGTRCGIEVETPGASGGAERVAAIERVFTQPFWKNDGPWCKADSRFKGSSSLKTPRG